MKRQVILVILDGWGIGPKNSSNPIYAQGTPNIDYIKNNFPIGALQASGISVGLPWGEEGNSEVGHLTLGAGKIIYQHYPRITLSIRDNSFSKNKVFLDIFNHVKKYNSSLNIAGLYTQANIHASFDHLLALIKLAQKNKVEKINLHIFTDGIDSEPKSILKLLKKLEEETVKNWRIGSISGKFYSLDQDSHWDQTKQAYDVMIGNGPKTKNIEEVVKKTYEKKLSDQYIEPHVIESDAVIKNNDALFFFNFREDSIRQIVSPFVLKNFTEFPTKKIDNLFIGTMTHYSDKFDVPVAYPPEKINNPIAKILSDNKKMQLHIAETEKYAHTTYFFNGFKEQPFFNEYRVLIPSHRVANHAEKPEMQAAEITLRVVQVIEDQSFDFVVINYANGDLMAHTGNYDAAKIAVKTIDEAIGTLVRAALQHNTILVIASDHGNVEIMTDVHTGKPTTGHDPSPVPIYIVGNELAKPKSQKEIDFAEKETIGILSDVAPTILELMGIPKPQEMTGQSLLSSLLK